MNIEINNKIYEFDNGSTLDSIVEKLSLNPKGIAFAIDNQAIKRDKWSDTVLADGMKIIMIKAVCGG
jgi:sulfur carrier protein